MFNFKLSKINRASAMNYFDNRLFKSPSNQSSHAKLVSKPHVLSNQLSPCIDSFSIISSSRNKLLSTISSPNLKQGSKSKVPLTPSEFAIDNCEEKVSTSKFSPETKHIRNSNKENRNSSNFILGKANSTQCVSIDRAAKNELTQNQYNRIIPSRSFHCKASKDRCVKNLTRPQAPIRFSESKFLPSNKQNHALNVCANRRDYENSGKTRTSLNPYTNAKNSGYVQQNVMLKDLLAIRREIMERQNRIETDIISAIDAKKPKMVIHELCILKNLSAAPKVNKGQAICSIKREAGNARKVSIRRQEHYTQRKRPRDTPKLQQKILPDESFTHNSKIAPHS
eukprot:TRINITY_DN12686_c0_g1_i1.p1 TRINITY_DN12686_c0_g1~~TRINITY_DN12686_c0_g1_i1.p1  ORF type:complete len:339 (-),score=22.20 TRINITY_DN12686_c0_g1_i1:117-1133(-)